MSFLRSLAAASAALAKSPAGAAAANARLFDRPDGSGTGDGRARGLHTAGPASSAGGDERFNDPAYAENPMYFLLERHLLSSQLVTERDHRRSATFLNTHTDFSVPGILGVFLDSDKMAHTFDVPRANDLVFHYVVNNWLLGWKPPAFDLLAWDKDSTRTPAKMHSQYLRSCY